LIVTQPLHEAIREFRNARHRQAIEHDWHLLQQKWSPLEKLEARYRTRLELDDWNDVEQQLPFAVPPWWEPPGIVIAKDKETAKAAHTSLTATRGHDLRVYTDGSGINGKIGAAAVAPEVQITRTAYLGRDDTHTVYSAELEGIFMAITIALAQPYHNRLTIFTDSQSAIRAVHNPGSQ
jgi:hypothetical protein